jgi:2-iminobutanoate/2-iminopropanoate deaminase
MKRVIETDAAPKALGPYRQAIASGGFLWISMQLPIDPATGLLIEGDMAAQTRRIIKNVQGLLEAAGARLDDVVRATLYFADLQDFAEVNRAYAEYFDQIPAARSALQVVALPKNARLAIDVIGKLP